ncbi:MAG: hypothetical protein K2W95_33095 [Candidatus Obscuribacterales bacterium]|nr:hypothetical protein [Candidatus Obscuribacterales bacterium]
MSFQQKWRDGPYKTNQSRQLGIPLKQKNSLHHKFWTFPTLHWELKEFTVIDARFHYIQAKGLRQLRSPTLPQVLS